MNDAYVYTIVIDRMTRYIGKGSGIFMKRATEHLRTARRLIRRREAGEVVWAPNLYNRLAKAVSKGADVQIAVIARDMTDDQAFELERVKIDEAPKGQLWNLDGGGLGGRRRSDESRKKMSEAAKRRIQRPGELERLRALGKSADNIARLKATNAELARRPESRAKNAAAAKERWANPQKAARMMIGLGKRWSVRPCPGQLEFW
jgi:hypothetical protein